MAKCVTVQPYMSRLPRTGSTQLNCYENIAPVVL